MELPTPPTATSIGKAAHSRSRTSPARQPRCLPTPALCRPPARPPTAAAPPVRFGAGPSRSRRLLAGAAHTSTPPPTKRAIPTRTKRSPPLPKRANRRRGTHWASRRVSVVLTGADASL